LLSNNDSNTNEIRSLIKQGQLQRIIYKLRENANQSEKSKLNEISKKNSITNADIKNIVTIMSKKGIKLQKSVEKTGNLINAATGFKNAATNVLNQQKKSVFSGMFWTSKKNNKK
jgi:hypothetical protein